MQKLLEALRGTSRAFAAVAGIALCALMILTVADVVLRLLGHPIVGTYELVGMAGAVAVGFSLPLTSWLRGHVYVDSFIAKLPPRGRAAVNLVTRAAVLVLFLLLGWNLIAFALDLRRSGEVSPTLRLPFYPVAFGVGIACLLQCLVIAADAVKILRGRYE